MHRGAQRRRKCASSSTADDRRIDPITDCSANPHYLFGGGQAVRIGRGQSTEKFWRAISRLPCTLARVCCGTASGPPNSRRKTLIHRLTPCSRGLILLCNLLSAF